MKPNKTQNPIRQQPFFDLSNNLNNAVRQQRVDRAADMNHEKATKVSNYPHGSQLIPHDTTKKRTRSESPINNPLNDIFRKPNGQQENPLDTIAHHTNQRPNRSEEQREKNRIYAQNRRHAKQAELKALEKERDDLLAENQELRLKIASKHISSSNPFIITTNPGSHSAAFFNGQNINFKPFSTHDVSNLSSNLLPPQENPLYQSTSNELQIFCTDQSTQNDPFNNMNAGLSNANGLSPADFQLCFDALLEDDSDTSYKLT